MKNSLWKLVVLIGVFAMPFFVKGVFAMPAYPEPEQYVQPDGSTIELYSYGDEHYNFVGDADGKYEYVTQESSVMLMSALKDGNSRPANAVKGFDLCDEMPETSEIMGYPYTTYSPVSLFSTDTTTTQTLDLITIAVEFADVKFPESGFDGQSIYDMFFSTEEETISVNNYYAEVSNGKMQFIPAFEMTESDANADGYGKVADGVIKVLVDSNHPDPQKYSGEEQDAAIVSIIKDALAEADKYIDFSKFDDDRLLDINGKPFIYTPELVFSFVVAGYEASASSKWTDNSVWAHKFYVPGGVECDGVILLDYAKAEIDGKENTFYSYYVMTGAMFDDTHPMGIGAQCHELGHVLNLPDLYNTKGTENYDSIYTLSLMAKGSWGRKDASSVPSSMPTHLDAWCKFRNGWFNDGEVAGIDVSGLVDGETATTKILPALSGKEGLRCLLVFTTDNSEYYILENRIFAGFDVGLKYQGFEGYPALTSSGIAIWHVDEQIATEENIKKNIINTTTNPGVSLVRSGAGSEFYNSSKPLWSSGINRLPFFGKLSYPNSDLNTYTDSSDSGVEIEFLSVPTDELYVRFGDTHVKKALYVNNGKVAVRLFNNTTSAVTLTPIVAKYNGTSLDDVIALSELTVQPGETSITDEETFSVSSARNYKVFAFDFANLKPAFEPLRFTLQ